MQQTRASFAHTLQVLRSHGLLSRYLFHPSSHHGLQSILKYHVALYPFYYQDLLNHGLHPVSALLTNKTRLNNRIRQQVRFGSALVEASDLPVSNSVTHMVHAIQISHRRLLRDIDANLMEIVLTWVGLKDQIESTDWLVLTPADNAPRPSVSLEWHSSIGTGDQTSHLAIEAKSAFGQIRHALVIGWEQGRFGVYWIWYEDGELTLLGYAYLRWQCDDWDECHVLVCEWDESC